MPHWLEVSADAMGLCGVVVVLLTYLLMQLNRLSQTGWLCSLLNFVGSICIAVSLMQHWNLPSFIIEVAWAVISLLGLVRYFIYRSRSV